MGMARGDIERIRQRTSIPFPILRNLDWPVHEHADGHQWGTIAWMGDKGPSLDAPNGHADAPIVVFLGLGVKVLIGYAWFNLVAFVSQHLRRSV